jgi:hypothetical protein
MAISVISVHPNQAIPPSLALGGMRILNGVVECLFKGAPTGDVTRDTLTFNVGRVNLGTGVGPTASCTMLLASFAYRAGVRYRVFQSKAVQLVGAGKTVDFSSGGVLFTTSEPLPTGRLVEISVTWPARLDGTCPLQFVATGRIVRADAANAAMRIERYEFKTLSSAALTAGA